MTDVPLFRSRRHTVLVIEDDSANRRLTASMLPRERSTVRTAAADCERGLFAALDPDLALILLDIGLPTIDGLVIRAGAGRQFDPELSPMILEILDGTIVRPN